MSITVQRRGDAIARGRGFGCCRTPPAPPSSVCLAQLKYPVAMLVGNGDPSAEKHLGNLPPPVVQEETLKNQISSWETLRTGPGVEGSPNVGWPPVFPWHHCFPSRGDFC